MRNERLRSIRCDFDFSARLLLTTYDSRERLKRHVRYFFRL